MCVCLEHRIFVAREKKKEFDYLPVCVLENRAKRNGYYHDNLIIILQIFFWFIVDFFIALFELTSFRCLIFFINIEYQKREKKIENVHNNNQDLLPRNLNSNEGSILKECNSNIFSSRIHEFSYLKFV